VVHDGDAITELIGLFHVVRRQHDGLARVVQTRSKIPERETTLRVQAGRRFVHEEHGGLWKIARATIRRWAMPPERA